VSNAPWLGGGNSVFGHSSTEQVLGVKVKNLRLDTLFPRSFTNQEKDNCVFPCVLVSRKQLPGGVSSVLFAQNKYWKRCK
jgi:hypothetical protein